MVGANQLLVRLLGGSRPHDRGRRQHRGLIDLINEVDPTSSAQDRAQLKRTAYRNMVQMVLETPLNYAAYIPAWQARLSQRKGSAVDSGSQSLVADR